MSSSSKQKYNLDDSGDYDREDPYNQPSAGSSGSSSSGNNRYSLLEQQYLADTARAEQQQQFAYDSMSTILEVDSEGSELSADRSRTRDSASVSAFLSAGNKTRMLPRSSSSGANQESRSMSPIPIPEGKNFSGTLSALARQVERLSQETPRGHLEKSKNGDRTGEDRDSSDDHDHDHSPSSPSAKSNQQTADEEYDEEISLNSTTSNTTPSSGSNINSTTNADNQEVEEEEEDEIYEDEESAGEERARSRPISAAESLMMIAISPMVSPRIRGFPMQAVAATRTDGRQNDDDDNPRRLVEVSNKSTITSIDFKLMDKMVEKYFVDKLDKGIQSIAFDCEESGDTINYGGNKTNNGRRSGALAASSLLNGNQPNRSKPTMKSIAVGTEKFSRERFSLLPPTKTRSTQTKSNIDNDIGASETRRFKLNHQDFGSLRRSRQNSGELSTAAAAAAATASANSELDEEVKEKIVIDETKKKSTAQNRNQSSKHSSGLQSSSSSQEYSTRASTTKIDNPIKKNEEKESSNEDSIDKRDSSASEAAATPTKNEEQARTSGPEMQHDSLTDSSNASINNESQKRPKSSTPPPLKSPKQVAEETGDKKLVGIVGTSAVNESLSIVNRGAASTKPTIEIPTPINGDGRAESNQIIIRQGGLIPNLKTELRVIIEFNDSRQKQRSEVTSNSQLLDGKLSKQTQINTSKHVRTNQVGVEPQAHSSASASSSPREVYRRLESAGREHSLMFNNENKSSRMMNNASLTPLRAASSMSSLAKENQESINWRQVSKSSICNEIETDTHRSWRKQQHQGANKTYTTDHELKHINQQLLMSTDARIKHTPDSKSALELRSRAARRYERFERDPVTKQPVNGSGKMVERTLVQSEAGFDENDIDVVKTSSSSVPVAKAIPTRMESRESETKPLLRISDSKRKPSPPPPIRPKFVQEPESSPQTKPTKKVAASGQAEASPVTTKTTRLEIEEESENRRQVTRNGRLVFDDRLNERRYETHRSVAAGGSPQIQRNQQAQHPVQSPSPAASSPGPPLLSPGSGILRNAHMHSPIQRQLLRPISLRASPIQQLNDQTSNLSSDPETMDSGIAPSGAGSSNALNQRPATAGAQAASQSRSPRPIAADSSQSNRQSDYPRQQQQEEPTSLTFVDDDDEDENNELDEFVKQLGTEKEQMEQSVSFVQVHTINSTTQNNNNNNNQSVDPNQNGNKIQGIRQRQTTTDILPPPQFRSTTSAAPAPLTSQVNRGFYSEAKPGKSSSNERGANTELITRLTRSRQSQQQQDFTNRRATQTKFEQNLIASNNKIDDLGHQIKTSDQLTPQKTNNNNNHAAGCRLKTQVMFESDTDSSMVLEQRSNQANKELLSETKYLASGRRTHSPLRELEEPTDKELESGGSLNGKMRADRKNSNPNSMDYSLRVHRMRGSQVDSKVSTFIKHSRQPLINLEAS